MKWLKNLLAKFASLFRNDAVKKELERAVSIANSALPIISRIADLTPTRVDNEIIDLFRYYALPGVESWLNLAPEDRGRALAHAATKALAKQYPGEPTRILDAAVQIAFTAWRADRTEE